MRKIRLRFTEQDYSKKFKIIACSIILLAAFIATFVLFPPNAIYNKIFSNNDRVATRVFEQALADSSLYLHFSNVQYIENQDTVTFSTDTCRLNLDKGSYIVAVVSSGCKYCKQSCELMHEIFVRNQLPADRFKILVWGSEEGCARFMRITKTWEYEARWISPVLAIDMVYGAFPTFIEVSDGKVVGAFDYRGISESEIGDFLKMD